MAERQRPGRDLADERDNSDQRDCGRPNPGPSWHVEGTGDFNGDGKSDILWQHDSGLPAIWTMDGTNITAGGAALPNPGHDWHLI